MGYSDVTTQLTAASDALNDEDAARLDEAMGRLTDAYDTVKMTERARVARLQAARTEADLSQDEQGTITTFERSFMSTYFGRGGFIAGAELYLLDPDEADASELASQASTLAEREQQLETTADEAAPVLDEVSIPARLGILSFSAVDNSPTYGETATVELVLQNVGDEPAENVEAVVEAATLDDSQSASFDSIEAGTHRSQSFDIPATVGGAVEVGVTVESATAGSVSETTTITVRTKQSIVRNAKDALEQLRTRTESTVDESGLERSITSKLDAAIQSLERALSKIEAGDSTAANDAIGTAMNQLGALLNTLLSGDGQRGNGESQRGNGDTSNGGNGKNAGDGDGALPEPFERAMVNRSELAIDQLSDARNTPLAD